MALTDARIVSADNTGGKIEQLSERVARIVREAIMMGEMSAPSYVRTEHLAAELGVSPTPVREALMILHAEGAVHWEPRKGYRVNPITSGDISDLFDVQAYIAGELAARAAGVMDAEELARIQGIQGELEAAAKGGEISRVDRLNHEIHRSINTASDSARMAAMLQQTVMYVPLGFFARIEGWAEASAHDHEPIFAALRSRDADAARSTMAEHIRHIGTLLVDHLNDHGAMQQRVAD